MTAKDLIKKLKKFPNYEVISDGAVEYCASKIEGAVISKERRIIILLETTKYIGTALDYTLEEYEKKYKGKFEILFGEIYKQEVEETEYIKPKEMVRNTPLKCPNCEEDLYPSEEEIETVEDIFCDIWLCKNCVHIKVLDERFNIEKNKKEKGEMK